MNTAKSLLLSVIGLVLCLANTTTAALVPPVLKSPPNGSVNVPPSGVTLDWAAARSAAGYDYVVKDAKGKVVKEGSLSGSKTQIRVNLDYEQTYKWQVRSTHPGMKASSWSTRWSFTTAEHPRPGLVAPADGASGVGSVQSDGMARVLLEWTALNGSTRYELQLASNASFSGATTRAVNGTATELLLDKSGPVFWRIRSLVVADKPYWSATRSFTPISPRETTEILSPRDGELIGGGSIQLSWLGVAGVRLYKWTLYEGKTPGGKVYASRTVSGLSDTVQWSDVQNAPPMGYLTLVVSGGGRTSKPSVFAFKSVAPQLREGRWGAYNRYYISWSRVGGNQGYEVTITGLDGSPVLNQQVSRNIEHLEIPAARLPKAGFKYSVKATGFNGILGDSSPALPEAAWGN